MVYVHIAVSEILFTFNINHTTYSHFRLGYLLSVNPQLSTHCTTYKPEANTERVNARAGKNQIHYVHLLLLFLLNKWNFLLMIPLSSYIDLA